MRTRLGDNAVTEHMLQVCLGGGPGTGANSRSRNRAVRSFQGSKRGNSLSETGDSNMKRFLHNYLRPLRRRAPLLIAGVAFLLATPARAQQSTSPWENAVNVLQTAFTSTIARGLSLVAIVVAGLTFAFGEGGSKRVLAGVLFGVGMAIAAVNFMAWLFP